MKTGLPRVRNRYPASIRAVHWIRAALIVALLATGLYMTGRAEDDVMAGFLYPDHKQIGVLVWLLAVVHLGLRWRYGSQLPHMAQTLKQWEQRLSLGVHRVLMALTLLTPLLGYAMSSSLPDGDGVPFFVVARIPEILPKSDTAFLVFQALHKYSAYLMLACIGLHVAGALKHRLKDRGSDADVLQRML
ncbi:cytochrome b [Rhizobium sp. SG2393]|uniref:cytochrome b n=1 Tax=Rhizobium sp. SG2393 TaxID=3276279 RepID=UPI00366A6EF1